MQYTDESRHCPWCGRWVTPDILAADHLGGACQPSSREAWRQAREAHRRRVRRIQAEAARRDGTPATIRRAGIPPWEDPGHIQAFASMLAERNLPDDGPEPWRPPAPEPHRDDLKTRILAHVNGGWMSGASGRPHGPAAAQRKDVCPAG